MAGFYNLYLPMILLMRSGDIETNPGPNTPESTVSEEEFILLSELIDPSKYKRLGNRLGMTYAVLKHIKIQARDDYSDAFMEVFTKWSIKQLPGTDTRAILAEELETCGLGELSGRLLDGSLLSNATSKPSVPPTSPPSPPSPPHQPLSPELIQKCAEDFKFEYGNSLCKIRADPLNPDSLVQFEDMYTNLRLEEENGRYKQVLEYSDLVNLKGKTKFSKRLLVQGEAGAGKTTLCSKIAWDWISGKHFLQFVWVIIVPLREAKKYSIGEIAKSYLTSNNPTTASQLTEYMHLNTDKVFIVLDGLDEFNGHIVQLGEGGSQTSRLQSSQSQGQSSNPSGSTQYQDELQGASDKKKASLGEMEIRLEEIFQSEKLETALVLVTTRPWKAVEIRKHDRLSKKYTFLFVQGFSKENVASYIKKYFVGDKVKAESLIKFANDNDVISENMAPYPIYISMLCLMWREFADEKQKTMKALQTFSQIFEEIFVFLKEHYALKIANPSCSLDESLNKCLQDINNLLEPIASLALDGLLNNTLVFSKGDFERYQDSMKTACRVGVLSEESRIILGKGRRDARNPRLQPTVFFPHKLFQEFMAGIHLASLYETDNREYNRLMETITGHRKEEFRYLLYFTASQNQRVGIDVLTHIEEAASSRAEMYWIEQSSLISTRDKHFLVDVAFECHDTHAAAVIKDKISPEDGTLVLEDNMTAHTLAGYAFIKPDMANLTVERKCGPTMSHEVAEMICSVPSLRKVALDHQLHNNFFTTMAAKGQFSKIQSLTIFLLIGPSNWYGDTPALHDLAVAVGTMPKLTDLTLEGVRDGHRDFFSKLKSLTPSMKIQSLTIKFGRAKFYYTSALHDLAVAVGTIPNLTDLTLEGVGDSHKEFFSKLKSVTPSMKIHSLRLSDARYFGVSRSAFHDLSVAMATMPDLTELTLERFQLEFFSILRSEAASMEGCFPQITTGNFHLNGTHCESLESFQNELSNLHRETLTSNTEGSFDMEHANEEAIPQRLSAIPSDLEVQHPTPASTDDNYVCMHPGVTFGLESMRSRLVQEAGNRAGMSDDWMYSGHSDPANQEYFQRILLQNQVDNKCESARLSSPVQCHPSTRQHPYTLPLLVPHQGSDSSNTIPNSAHHLSQSVNKFASGSNIACSESSVLGQVSDAHDRSCHGQLSPITAGSSSGRSQGLKRTAPCTLSRVPVDVPEKLPRVGILEESPSVHLCDFSCSDDISASEEI